MLQSPRVLFAVLLALAVLLPGQALAQAPQSVPGEKYALLVGINHYRSDSALANLRYTERDVMGLAEVLKESGYRPENVVVLTRQTGRDDDRFEPRGDNIRREIMRLLRNCTKNDALLLAFAGHGVQYVDSDEVYFCPADARLEEPKSLLPLTEVYKDLEKCQAGLKLLLSDACRSKIRVTRPGSRSVRGIEVVPRPQHHAPPAATAALFACSEGEEAMEDAALRHGVFFHFVIQGLRHGEADLDKNGEIEVEELSLFTKKRVPDYVRQLSGGPQTPHLVTNSPGLMPIVKKGAVVHGPATPLPAPKKVTVAQLRTALIELENSILWAAMTEAWRERRTTWIQEVGQASTLEQFAAALRVLENYLRWEAVVASWSPLRAEWCAVCSKATAPGDVAKLLIILESAISWDAVSETWGQKREAWQTNLRN